MATNIKNEFQKKFQNLSIDIKSILKEHGSKKVGEVNLSQVYQGMRGITGLVTETSLLDPQEGIRFRGYSINELRNLLPKASGGQEPLPEGTILFNAYRVYPYTRRSRASNKYFSAKKPCSLSCI